MKDSYFEGLVRNNKFEVFKIYEAVMMENETEKQASITEARNRICCVTWKFLYVYSTF